MRGRPNGPWPGARAKFRSWDSGLTMARSGVSLPRVNTLRTSVPADRPTRLLTRSGLRALKLTARESAVDLEDGCDDGRQALLWRYKQIVEICAATSFGKANPLP